MNVYECNGKNIFMSWNMECSIQRGEAYGLEILKFVYERLPNV